MSKKRSGWYPYLEVAFHFLSHLHTGNYIQIKEKRFWMQSITDRYSGGGHILMLLSRAILRR